MGDKDRYGVVFEHTAAAGGYEGARYWTLYESKAQFEEMRPDSPKLIVVAEGVSSEKAKELYREAPLESFVGAALEECRGMGVADPFMLQMELGTKLGGYFDMAGIPGGINTGIDIANRMAERVSETPGIDRVFESHDRMLAVRRHLAGIAEQAMARSLADQLVIYAIRGGQPGA